MKYLGLFVCLILLFGCEKDINIQPEIQEPLLVVDGMIESNQPPMIILSKSLNYFGTFNTDLLQSSLVKNAKVTLNNGSKTVALKEYTVPVGGVFSINYFTTDSSNPASNMVGQVGKTYLLTIDYGGKRYEAKTVIPVSKKSLDSIWWKPAPKNDDTMKVVLMGRFTDPAGYGDYVRYFTKVNSGPYLPGINSVFDDNVIDGTTYDFQIDQGVNRNDIPNQENYGYFLRGDTTTIKFCRIDRSSFDFWRTLEFSYQSTGNPFSTPTKVMGNVSNGALGAFCGYSVLLRSLVIPK